MFQQCPQCKSSTLSLLYKPTQCIHCRLSVCPNCYDSAANKCRRCAPAAVSSACSRCGGAAIEQTRCLTCRGLVCNNCVAFGSGTRVVCNGCPRPQDAGYGPPSSPPPPLFECGRCRCAQQREAGYPPAGAEYCSYCARLICAGCADVSMHSGSFVCSFCCPHLAFETVLPKAPPLLRTAQSAPQAQPSVYPPTQPIQPTFSVPAPAPAPAPVQAHAPTMTQTAAAAASPISVVTNTGATIQMMRDAAGLMRHFSLRLDERVHCYLEDTEHPNPARVAGYSSPSVVVLVVEYPAGQRWVPVDPGFLIREPARTAVSPTTPNASMTSNTSSQLGYPTAWNFVSKSFLAQGAQGQVHKCTTSDNRVVVTKEMKFPKTDLQSFHRQLEQARQIKSLRHNHLIQYLDVLESVDQTAATVTIITPFYNERDLREFVKNQQFTIDEHHISSLILQVAGALEYLHTRSPPLVHRDVKPENILMCSNGEQALLMDLDTCKPANRSVTVGLGTMEYMAPEAMNGAASVKSDIWSLGVVMFVLAALPEFPTLPRGGSEVCLNESSWTDIELRRAVITAIGKKSRQYSRTFVELILKMLRRDPNQRPSAAEVSHEVSLALENLLLGQGDPMSWDV